MDAHGPNWFWFDLHERNRSSIISSDLIGITGLQVALVESRLILFDFGF